MIYKLLQQIIKENDIPEDVKLMSDSGWECDATEMDGIFYNKKENILVFTQDGHDDQYWENEDYKCLYRLNNETDCLDCKHFSQDDNWEDTNEGFCSARGCVVKIKNYKCHNFEKEI